MNKMKTNRKFWVNCSGCLFAALWAILGFSCAVDEGDPQDIPQNSHNQPYARYSLKGKVINKRNERVPAIQLIIGEVYKSSYTEWTYIPDTLYSDTKGEFSYLKNNALPNSQLRVKYQAIDRLGNIGIYKTDSIDVDMGVLTGGNGGWYEGEASRQIIIEVIEKEQ